jgi:hypothetical protein
MISAGVAAYPRSNATFDIAAESEYVMYSPELTPEQYWILDDAIIRPNDSAPQTVSGKLKFTDAVHVVVERKSLGSLFIKIEPTPERQRAAEGRPMPIPVGEFTEHGGVARLLHDYVEIEIPNIEERSRRGQPIVFAIHGSLQVGRSVQREPDPNLALLRSGKVTKFMNSIIWSSAFTAGSVELDAGDQVTIEAPTSSELGLIRIDERPALTVAYRAEAPSVKVARPGGGQYWVRMSSAERALADPVLQHLWAALVFFSGVFTVLKASDTRKDTSNPQST